MDAPFSPNYAVPPRSAAPISERGRGSRLRSVFDSLDAGMGVVVLSRYLAGGETEGEGEAGREVGWG